MEKTRGMEMSAALSMAALTRAWQMLLKGLMEVRSAPSAVQAAKMILVRLMYGLELPSPADALKKLKDAPQTQSQPQPGGGAPAGGGGGTPVQAQGSAMQPGSNATHGPTMMAGGAQAQTEAQPLSVSELELPDPQTFLKVVELAENVGEMILHANLISNVHVVRFQPGQLEFRPGEHALPDLSQRLLKMLNDHTARRWSVTVSRDPGHPTLQQQQEAEVAAEKAEAARDPLVQKVLEAFPGAEITAVTDTTAEVPPLRRPLEDEEIDDD